MPVASCPDLLAHTRVSAMSVILSALLSAGVNGEKYNSTYKVTSSATDDNTYLQYFYPALKDFL